MIPVSLIDMLATAGVGPICSMMPPAGPGTSLIISMFCRRCLQHDRLGWPARPGERKAEHLRHAAPETAGPDRGEDRPASNSIHTPGSQFAARNTFTHISLPASGRHGSHQAVSGIGETAGTGRLDPRALHRIDVVKHCPAMFAVISFPTHVGTTGTVGDEPVASQLSERLLVLAALDLMGDLGDMQH